MNPGPLDLPKKYEYWIKNGHVIDPARGTDKIEDILISKSRIVDFPSSCEIDEQDVKHIIDAKGYYVLPGLIDFHGHFAWMNASESCMPDSYELPNGVTSACDGGSTGSSGFDGFLHNTILQTELTMKALVNVASGGMPTNKYVEDIHPQKYDKNELEYLFERYSDYIVGLKLRIGKGFSDDLGLEPLNASLKLAEKMNTILALHPTNTLEPMDKIMDLMRRGDILCHPFHDMGGYNLLDENARVQDSAWKARKRGVIFDCAHGRVSFSFAIACSAVEQDFYPDVISTDVSALNIYEKGVFSLPMVMSKFLAIGMPLFEVVRACTQTPARLMGMDGKIGTLCPGSLADVCIIEKRDIPVKLSDYYGNTVDGNSIIVPQMTIKAGKTKYCHTDFILRQ